MLRGWRRASRRIARLTEKPWEACVGEWAWAGVRVCSCLRNGSRPTCRAAASYTSSPALVPGTGRTTLLRAAPGVLACWVRRAMGSRGFRLGPNSPPGAAETGSQSPAQRSGQPSRLNRQGGQRLHAPAPPPIRRPRAGVPSTWRAWTRPTVARNITQRGLAVCRRAGSRPPPSSNQTHGGPGQGPAQWRITCNRRRAAYTIYDPHTPLGLGQGGPGARHSVRQTMQGVLSHARPRAALAPLPQHIFRKAPGQKGSARKSTNVAWWAAAASTSARPDEAESRVP